MQRLLKTHWHAIVQDWKCIQHAISILLASIFADMGNWGHPAVQLLHTPLSMQIYYSHKPLALSSPPMTHSLHLCIQGSHIHSICQLSHPFLSGGGITSTAFLRSSHINSNCSQNHRSTGHCTCVFIFSKPCAEAWGQQKPRFMNFHTLYAS